MRYLSKNQDFISELIIVMDPIKGLSELIFKLKIRFIISSYKLRIPVHLLLSPDRLYAGSARNRGWMKAKSDWIMFLDADDEYSDSRFSIIADYIALTPAANVLVHSYCSTSEEFSDLELLSKTKKLPKLVSFESIKFATLQNLGPDDNNVLFVPDASGGFYPVHHGHLAVKRSIMNYHMFPSTIKAEDTDFCRSVLFGAGGVFHIPLKLSRYHPHKSSWRNNPWPVEVYYFLKHQIKYLIK
jgi:glycosyltransferase involved in cell wall biosynthesis